MSARAHVWSVLLASVVSFAPAFGQDTTASGDEAPIEARDTLQVQDGAFVIKGKVQKPEVVIVVGRQSLERDFDLGLQRSFLQDIIASVHKETFSE